MFNHYIPQFYTKRWLSNYVENGKNVLRLTRYTRPYKLVVPDFKVTGGVGGQDDIYTKPNINDGTENELEVDYFGKIDQKASIVFDKIEKFGLTGLVDNDRIDWVRFLLSLRQRNPERLIEIGESAEQIIFKNLEKYRNNYLKIRKSGDPLTFEEFMERYKSNGKLALHRLMVIREAIDLPKTTALIAASFWKIRNIGDHENELLTSDRPVLIDATRAVDGGKTIIPISPRSIMYISNNLSIIKEIEECENISAILNDQIVREARKEVYGSTTLQTEFVEERLRESGARWEKRSKKSKKS